MFFDGVDFEYSVISDFIKENIILKKAASPSSFEFSLYPKDLTPELKDNAVEFKKRRRRNRFCHTLPIYV